MQTREEEKQHSDSAEMSLEFDVMFHVVARIGYIFMIIHRKM